MDELLEARMAVRLSCVHSAEEFGLDVDIFVDGFDDEIDTGDCALQVRLEGHIRASSGGVECAKPGADQVRQISASIRVVPGSASGTHR